MSIDAGEGDSADVGASPHTSQSQVDLALIPAVPVSNLRRVIKTRKGLHIPSNEFGPTRHKISG